MAESNNQFIVGQRPGSESDDALNQLFRTSIAEAGSNAGRTWNIVDLWDSSEKAEKIAEKLDPADNKGVSVEVSEKDEYGHQKVSYGQCTHCGKELEKPSGTGFCSNACFLKHKLNLIKGGIDDLREETEDIVGNIAKAVELANGVLSLLSDMQQLLASLAARALDDRYLVYFKTKLNIVILYLRYQVNRLLIWKNNLMIAALDKVQKGINVANSALGSAFDAIQKGIDAVMALIDQFNQKYKIAYDVIVQSLIPFLLDPEALHFGVTPRSLTYYPGKEANKIPNVNLNDSNGDVIDMDGLQEVVRGAFPRITEPEYLMDPTAFKARMMLSDYNYIAIQKMVEPILDLMKLGSEPMPKYEKLNITNAWWMVYLLLAFGPEAQKHYGLPFYP